MSAGTRPIRICGTGSAVPRHIVTSAELDVRLKLEPGTVYRKSGVLQRHQAIDETAADLAAEACEGALDRAGLDWTDIDCLVATSATMDQALPFNAALVLSRLGWRSSIPAFDVGASCMSFLVGLDLLATAVASGRYRHVLLVSSDIATFALDWQRLGESAIFGDGAAAAIIRRSEPGESSCILSSRIATFPEGVHFCRIEAGGSRFHPRRVAGSVDERSLFRMDGARLFRLAAREIPGFVDELLRDAGLEPARVDVVVPHQASRLAIDHLVRRLSIDPSRVSDIFETHGNQVAASLPSALHHALTARGLERGQSMLMLGAGAGVTLGGMAMVY